MNWRRDGGEFCGVSMSSELSRKGVLTSRRGQKTRSFIARLLRHNPAGSVTIPAMQSSKHRMMNSTPSALRRMSISTRVGAAVDDHGVRLERVLRRDLRGAAAV